MKFVKKLLRNTIRIVLMVVVLVAIPLTFNKIFKGNDNSSFYFIDSSMSVSDWFSFWIAYISVIVSSILAYAAIHLSNTIEKAHGYREAENNISLFCVENIPFVPDGNDCSGCNLVISMPYHINTLGKVKITKAKITFSNGEKINLECSDGIEGNIFKLSVAEQDRPQYSKNMRIWWGWERNMAIGFETIDVNITYKYELRSLNTNKKFKKYFCETETYCKIKAGSLDQHKITTSNYRAQVYINKESMSSCK